MYIYIYICDCLHFYIYIDIKNVSTPARGARGRLRGDGT